MSIFRGIVDFLKGYSDYRDSVAALVAYLPEGDLETLVLWRRKWVPYRSDTDTGEADGEYDKLQNYNGADLTLKAGHGDCESRGAICKEVISSPEWAAKGWASEHIYFSFIRPDGTKSAHDVAYYTHTDGRKGWIEGRIVHEGDYNDLVAHYAGLGWNIIKLWAVNDMGEKVRDL